MKSIKNIFAFVVALMIYFPARIIYATCSKEVIKPTSVQEYENSGKPYIAAFWHGRLFPMGFTKSNRERSVFAIISRHGDGEIIAYVLRMCGVKAIRGSTNRSKGEHKKGFPAKNRGGAFVIRESIRVLEDGSCIAMTPDGPRGPRFKFKKNFIKVAAATGTPIIPISFSASNAAVIKSWDRFIFPKPFSKIKIEFGELIYVPKVESDEDIEKYGNQIESVLNNITYKLDNEFGIKLD